jgi:D-glycero-D-manno-heptose 1,7-bisphosphate phosphatase
MKLVFLDRDGTLNVDHGYVHRWDQWEFIPGAVAALRLFCEAGFELALVSNQSGVARGMFDRQAVERLHDRVVQALSQQQIPLAAIAFCPHSPEADCGCRKPRTGLAAQIAAQLSEPIDYGASWTVGDKPSDVEFGRRLGTRTVLLASRYWQQQSLIAVPDLIAADLQEAARRVLQQLPHRDSS